MRYMALACDYDGTIAGHGIVAPQEVTSLKRLAASGRKLILVTGRLLEDLIQVFPDVSMFDIVVGENGAALYWPSTGQIKVLGESPPARMIQLARARGIEPLNVGHAIVDTRVPHESTMVEIIRELGLEWQLIFNKGAVMVLPTGINKATGLKAALRELGLSPHNVVGVGDAENDHALLSLCECGAAVANALPTLQERADLVTTERAGSGVTQLIDRMISTDLSELETKLVRHDLKIGSEADGKLVALKPYRSNVLVAGPSGSGKSGVAHALIERLVDSRYQFCLIDPEGDFQELDKAVVLGNSQRPPTLDEIMHLLQNPSENAVINLMAVPIGERPNFFAMLTPHLHDLFAKTGRPHWLIMDEAHHMLPSDRTKGGGASASLNNLAGSLMIVTVHPEHVSQAALSMVDSLITVGRYPHQTVRSFCNAAGITIPEADIPESNNGNVIAWFRGTARKPFSVHIEPSKAERKRHRRKYAQGDVGYERSFIFRGPESKLKLRAQNLVIFLQMAEGVDEETWMFHLRRQDYSRWLRDSIKDDELAHVVAGVETQSSTMNAEDSLKAVKFAIEGRYGGTE
ncbi:MAG: HAD-IIB family hydrolase [Candidatus Obscuribacterales bacterium]|jgi:hydroxymethylpyrimidine pyrophosphatase-like HAD family hydrolase|nr:HAD-IIB family hydrolase [Candidatus Obscuribacterales bacterium]